MVCDMNPHLTTQCKCIFTNLFTVTSFKSLVEFEPVTFGGFLFYDYNKLLELYIYIYIYIYI